MILEKAVKAEIIISDAFAVDCGGIEAAVLVPDINNPGKLKISDDALKTSILQGVLSGHNQDLCPLDNPKVKKTIHSFATACGGCALSNIDM